LVWQKPLSLKSLGKPIIFDGWQNGWNTEGQPEGEIIFFFLPQLLEYFGFLLILIFIVLLAIF